MTSDLNDVFIEACKTGNIENINILLKDVNINPAANGLDGLADAPLRIACYNGHTEIVKLLLKIYEICH